MRRDPGAATSPQSMRERNLHALLNVFWSNADDSLTAKELMDASGLTRASVLDICRTLSSLGWITEGAGARADTPGRRARQFQFNPGRSLVVGADVSHTSVSAVVSDLAGQVLGSAERQFAVGYPWESAANILAPPSRRHFQTVASCRGGSKRSASEWLRRSTTPGMPPIAILCGTR